MIALDWHPKTDLLLSASTDRGVLVWGFDAQFKGLRPTMCVVKEPKANLDATWNARGDKFAVGTASGNVFIGVYDKDQQFWIADKSNQHMPNLHIFPYSCQLNPYLFILFGYSSEESIT